MVNLEWYRTFKAVYQTGSLTAAAKVLFISQPNVSQHLTAPEAHVGKTLFERKPRIVPTEYGKLFYVQVVEPLEKLEKVEANFTAACLKTQAPVIRLGTVQEYFHTVLSAHLADVDAHLVLSFGRTHELLAKLHKGTLDFAVATKQTDYKNIFFEPVRQERFVVAGSEGIDTGLFDQFVGREDWHQAEAWLLSQQWFSYSADLAIIRKFWQKNFAKRPAINPYYVIPDMNLILKSLKHCDGLTIAADYLVDEELRVIWKGKVPAENTLYMAYDKTKVTADVVSLMKQFLTRGSV